MQYQPLKPRAVVLAHLFEGRASYFFSGLSHFYRLEIFYTTNRRFRFVWQIFYRWLYASDVVFIPCNSLEEVLQTQKKFDAAFIQEEAIASFTKRFENQNEVAAFLSKLKTKAPQIYWLEVGEISYFSVARPDFWELVTAVIKGQVFKKDYWPWLKDINKINNFQSPIFSDIQPFVKENQEFDMARYAHKIIPFPFTPSITDPKTLEKLRDRKRVYDIAANTRTSGNGTLRYSIIKLIQKNLDQTNRHIYSFDYDEKGVASNLPKEKKQFSPYLQLGKAGVALFKMRYGKYFYPRPAYMDHLSHSKCYLGLGWTFSSLRTADCWGAGTVLINFSFEKCDYGLPVLDGVNYVSIGERDEYTSDNVNFKPEYAGAVIDKIEAILSNPVKQKEIVQNQLATYQEYFSSSKQFVKKMFIEKIKTL